MAQKHPSVQKRARQNIKRRMRNKAIKSEIKTYYKKVEESLAENNYSKAEGYARQFASKVDKAVQGHITPLNTGNRKKSRIMKLLQAAKNKKGRS
ncbi:MAG: 30S ribosomal protein S20 [Spirochaetes bacterium]|nr:30S ribosomal protein S20 [Spirochaetota bacterium]